MLGLCAAVSTVNVSLGVSVEVLLNSEHNAAPTPLPFRYTISMRTVPVTGSPLVLETVQSVLRPGRLSNSGRIKRLPGLRPSARAAPIVASQTQTPPHSHCQFLAF